MCLPGSNGTSEDDVFLNYCGANKCHEPQGVNDDSHSVSRDVHKCRLRFIYASCVSCCGLDSWPTLEDQFFQKKPAGDCSEPGEPHNFG